MTTAPSTARWQARPFLDPHPPAGRPTRRLRGGRAFRWTYEILAMFMAAVTVLTAILGEWDGTVICGLGGPAFWGLSRLFKRSQLAIYGSQLWQRDALGRWHAPLDLDHLIHVAYVRDRRDLRSGTMSLVLRAAPSPGDTRAPDATAEEKLQEKAVWAEQHETRIALGDYSRRGLERLIGPWVVGRPQIAADDLARRFEQRARHPRTAGIRTLLTRAPRAR